MNRTNPKIEVVISEDELRDLIRGLEFKWTLQTSEGDDVNVLVRLERFSDIEDDDSDEEENGEEEMEESDDSF